MTEDFYDLFEISSDASRDEIKEAYREQVRIYHPDQNDDSRARAQFTAIRKAYDILGDPVERKAYDRLGHETYVAKRTSGLPSPDVWRSDDSSDEDDDADAEAAATAGAATAGSSATGGSTTSTSTGSGSATGSSAGSASGATTSSESASSGSTTSGASRTAGATGSTGSAGTAAGSTAGARDSRASDGTDTATARETGETATSADSTTDNAVVRWWRRQSFGLPLLWLSLAVYIAGLGHFASANVAALETLRAEITAVGADPEGLRTALTSGRYGLETSVGFVTGAELVAPSLEPIRWYGGLAGVVVAALVAVLVARFVRAGDTWRPVTIDETIVVALTVGTTTALVGGPLLAGTVLMPLLFGVVVFQTRQGPGWTPTYLYALPVLAPAVGFVAAMTGRATLVVDIIAFVLVPVVGALCLPLRATVRTRFGR